MAAVRYAARLVQALDGKLHLGTFSNSSERLPAVRISFADTASRRERRITGLTRQPGIATTREVFERPQAA